MVGRGLVVEEHRYVVDAHEPLGKRMRGGHRNVGRGRAEGDERHHVDDAQTRVDPRVFTQVEVFEGHFHEASGGGLGATRVRRGDGEHAPVMIGVAVNIEERRACGRADSPEYPAVSPFRHVDDRLQHVVRVGGLGPGPSVQGKRRDERPPS